jgi:hypothetical protein
LRLGSRNIRRLIDVELAFPINEIYQIVVCVSYCTPDLISRSDSTTSSTTSTGTPDSANEQMAVCHKNGDQVRQFEGLAGNRGCPLEVEVELILEFT